MCSDTQMHGVYSYHIQYLFLATPPKSQLPISSKFIKDFLKFKNSIKNLKSVQNGRKANFVKEIV